MTIYFDEYFSGGTTQQIGSCERIVFDNDSNLDMLQTSSVVSPSTWETVLSAKLAKNARIRIDGFKMRDGSSAPAVGIRIPSAGEVPSLSIHQCMTIITSLVHMMGGAVSMDSVELDLASRKRRLQASQFKDPYRLQLNVTEDQ